MKSERRNPYVVLGVPFGSTEEEARTGFARASRRLRADSDQVYSMDDLTWALHQIEQIVDDPARAFYIYRIPADSEATSSAQPGIFNPEAQNLHRRTPASTAQEWEALRVQAARDVIVRELSELTVDLQLPTPYQDREAR